MIELSQKIIQIIETARSRVSIAVNTTMVHTYFEVGRMIVEELQEGKERAKYGTNLLNYVSKDLTVRLGKGFSETNLKQMRDFYHAYSIRQTVSDELNNVSLEKFKNLTFNLSWSHYLLLMRVENLDERSFYEIETHQNQWSVRHLQRQFNTSLYERLVLSRDKDKIKELAIKGQILTNPQDLLKEPLILEFLGLEEKNEYSESDLETAIINQIEKFMLELGKGFFFGGRQVRFTFDEDHFKVDLVFYNRLLQCFVLIDLKIGKLSHQDLGQMLMYTNYYDRFVKTENENKTIGIILCKTKNQSLVEITLPEGNNQIFASKYKTILPTKEDFTKILNDHEAR